MDNSNSGIIRKNAGVKSNWEYRQFMQNHGKEIMKVDTQEYFNASGNNPYYSSGQVQSTPFLFQHGFDNRSPANMNGLTEDSDLKRDFLKKERLAARMVAPTMFVQNDKIKHCRGNHASR